MARLGARHVFGIFSSDTTISDGSFVSTLFGSDFVGLWGLGERIPGVVDGHRRRRPMVVGGGRMLEEGAGR